MKGAAAKLKNFAPSAWSAGQLAIANGVDAIATLVQVAVLARFLSLTEFGVLGAALAWTVMASAFLDFRVWEVMTVMLPKWTHARQFERASSLVVTCFALELMGGLILAVVLIAIAPYASQLMAKSSQYGLVFGILALQPLILSIDEPCRTLTRLSDRYAWLAGWKVVCSLVQLTLVCWVAIVTQSVVWVAATQVVAHTIRVAGLAVIARGSLTDLALNPFRIKSLALLPVMLRRHASRLLHSTFFAFVGKVCNRSDIVLLACFSSPELVGPYELARRLASQVGLLLQPIEQVITAKVARLWRVNSKEYFEFLIRVSAVLAITALPGLALLAFAFPYLTELIFGKDYRLSGQLAAFLLIANVGIPLFWLRFHLLLLDRLKHLLILGGGVMVLQVVLCVSFIPAWAEWGAVSAVIVTQLSWTSMLALVCYLDWRYQSSDFQADDSS